VPTVPAPSSLYNRVPMQFVLASKDMPASFKPWHSAAQLAAADVPPPIGDQAFLPPAPRNRRLGASASESTLLRSTEAAKRRELARVRVSLQTMNDLAAEHRRQEEQRANEDPFTPAFSREEPTRLLVSKREAVRERIIRERAEQREVDKLMASESGNTFRPQVGRRPLGEQLMDLSEVNLPEPLPPLLREAAQPDPNLSFAERQRRAALIKIFGEHEYRMRSTMDQVKPPKRYVPPIKMSDELNKLNIERDSQRLMRKLLARPRSHGFE